MFEFVVGASDAYRTKKTFPTRRQVGRVRFFIDLLLGNFGVIDHLDPLLGLTRDHGFHFLWRAASDFAAHFF